MPGKKGDQGVAGPPGPSNVFHTSSVTPYAYISPAYADLASCTISSPGNYLILIEGTAYPDPAINETINIEIRKNGVAISGAQDQVKYNTPTPNESKKMAINTCVLNLVAGDIVSFSIQSDKDFSVGHRSLTLIKITNLILF